MHHPVLGQWLQYKALHWAYENNYGTSDFTASTSHAKDWIQNYIALYCDNAFHALYWDIADIYYIKALYWADNTEESTHIVYLLSQRTLESVLFILPGSYKAMYKGFPFWC